MSSVADDYFNSNTIARDAWGILAGKKLGQGIARHVYRCRLDPSLVLKVETAGQSFQNAIEWHLWNEISETKWAKYFAPCREISTCGTILLMDYAAPLPSYIKRPKMPRFITDTKRDNFGMLKGRVVAVDYAYTLTKLAYTGKKFRKIDRP